MLERLTYTSTETEPLGTLGLFNLLNQARQNNARLNLSGHLLYTQGTFTQCLEGPAESLDKLWASLQKDSRHQNIQLLDRSAISERKFSEWSMAFSSYRYLNTYNMPGFFPIDDSGTSVKSLLCKS